jgi:hypothetical protein
MTTWTWSCYHDGASGTAASQEDAAAAAAEHNMQAGHTSSAISYSNDDPPPDPAVAQWQTVDSVRGSQLRDTDYCVEPFTTDLPDNVRNGFLANEPAWLAFRQSLRDIQHVGDPTQLVWPTLPSSPPIVITPPPDFVDSSSWGDNWTPAA